jgi:hypothetical protein
VYTPTFIACHSCTREFWTWLQAFTNSKGRGKKTKASFYDHVKGHI